MNPSFSPTPYPEINALLGELLTGVRSILGPQFIGLYLDGSLAYGDFDADSDIDFVAVSDTAVDEAQFMALAALHERLMRFDPLWGIQLEGSYLPREIVRHNVPDPARQMHPNMERGADERLKLARHDETWNIHRWILREKGLTLAGPDPKTLVDPLSAEDLRRAMRVLSQGWMAHLLADPGVMRQRGYQSYVVLSLCRICYTMQTGMVTSKPSAVRWARENLDPRWQGLIEDAWVGRHQSAEPAGEDRIRETAALMREMRQRLFGE